MANFAEMEKRHATFYNGVLRGMTIVGAAVIALLAVMAVTLI
ncbi:hypothetical protein [Elstera cyanobacteriorum]|nr:hypothetical protein [Elstera cyanobacteriorum]